MKTKYFQIQELVPKAIYEKYGQRSWWFIDPRLCVVLDELREQTGTAIIINNANRNWSGFRTPEFTGYSPTSQHSHGRAADCVADWDVSYVREMIVNGEIKFSYPVSIEDQVSWLHIDVRNQDEQVRVFQP